MACTHVYYIHRGRRLMACDCRCKNCHNGMDCTCTDCSHDVEVHIEPRFYRKPANMDPVGATYRYCQDCDAEVFRTNGRGRWPLRCPACKKKPRKTKD
jgi:hypothetical protein